MVMKKEDLATLKETLEMDSEFHRKQEKALDTIKQSIQEMPAKVMDIVISGLCEPLYIQNLQSARAAETARQRRILPVYAAGAAAASGITLLGYRLGEMSEPTKILAYASAGLLAIGAGMSIAGFLSHRRVVRELDDEISYHSAIGSKAPVKFSRFYPI